PAGGPTHGPARAALRALAALREGMGPDHPALAPSYQVLAEVAAARKDVDGVRSNMARARELRLASQGPDDRVSERMHVDEAVLLEQAGLRDEAIGMLRQVIAADGGVVPYAQHRLAEILHADPSQRAEARSLGKQAERGFAAQDMHDAAAQVREWLEEHDE
ncbi:MAG: hypothetical protein AB1Z98_25640, partial [Nannocystaceae bacterium]